MNNNKPEATPFVFLTGLLIGSVLAALFTPKNGEELRNTIKERFETMKDSTKDAVDKAGQATEDKLDQAKSALQRSRTNGSS